MNRYARQWCRRSGALARGREPGDQRHARDQHAHRRRRHRPRATARARGRSTNDALQITASATSRARSAPANACGVALTRCDGEAAAIRFEREQRLLAREAARVAGQRAVAPTIAVAGDHDRHRIAAVRRADRAHRRRRPTRVGDVGVARGRAVGNRPQRLPHAAAGTACPTARAAGRTRCRRPANYSRSCRIPRGPARRQPPAGTACASAGGAIEPRAASARPSRGDAQAARGSTGCSDANAMRSCDSPRCSSCPRPPRRGRATGAGPRSRATVASARRARARAEGLASPRARTTPRSACGNASGQRSARSATYCAVHGPDAGQRGAAPSIVAARSAGRRQVQAVGHGERHGADRARPSLRQADRGELGRRCARRRRAANGNTCDEALDGLPSSGVPNAAARRPVSVRRARHRHLLADDRRAPRARSRRTRRARAGPAARRPAGRAPARPRADRRRGRTRAARARAPAAATRDERRRDARRAAPCGAAPARTSTTPTCTRRRGGAARACARTRRRRAASTPAMARGARKREHRVPVVRRPVPRARTRAQSRRAATRHARAAASAPSGSAARNSALKRRTLAKPLANATSVTGSAVSVSSRFASSSRCVCAYSTGDTPNSVVEHAAQVAVGDAEARGEPSTPPSVQHAVLDQVAPRACASRVPARRCRRDARRELGPAAQAGTEAARLGGRRAGEEAAVLAARRAHRAHRAAVDAASTRTPTKKRPSKRASWATGRGSRRRRRAAWRPLSPAAARPLAVFGPGSPARRAATLSRPGSPRRAIVPR